MALWLAVDKELKALGVEKAGTSDQAYYQFMQYSLYPMNVIELPDSVVLRFEDQIRDDDSNADGYYFSDRD